MQPRRKVAIIGMGPRGSFALEQLLKTLASTNSLHNIELLVFEETSHLGNGPVYDLNQTDANWINISERVLHLEEREVIRFGYVEIPAFPSYHQWASLDYDAKSDESPDIYPPRKKVGKYLQERFLTLIKPLQDLHILFLINSQVVEVDYKDEIVFIKLNNGEVHEAQEALITIGHQTTILDEQLTNWSSYSSDNEVVSLVNNPYPISDILAINNVDGTNSVALRGFGLAMIDVVRAVAEKFGQFEGEGKEMKYLSSQDLKNLFVPFSLNGLPPSPKPLNATIDNWFLPTKKHLELFEQTLNDKKQQKRASGSQFLIDAIAPIISDVFVSKPMLFGSEGYHQTELNKIIQAWLKDENFVHPLIQSTEISIAEVMQNFVDMACGEKVISLDFLIGQVWRHCQPTIYSSLSHNACSDLVFAEIISLDERMKRYSYGPPVSSIQQLLALADRKILNLDYVNDPEIEAIEEGWKLTSQGQSIIVEIMINTVLDSPKIMDVNSPIVKKLLINDLIQAVHDDLGVKADEQGYIISSVENQLLPIALLGRLAKGTVIGVDAILECFGDRPKVWAKQAAEHHVTWLTKYNITN